MTDEQIIKALECCVTYESCTGCPLVDNCPSSYSLLKSALDLINHYEAELEKKSAALGALLCHATGGKLSKDTYPMPVMGRAVTNYIEDCCTDAENTAVKEVAERIKQIICDHCYPDFNKDGKPINVWNATNGYKAIDNLVKERIGENNAKILLQF